MTLAALVASPFAGAIVIALAGGRLGRRVTGGIAAAAMAASFGAAAALAPTILARAETLDTGVIARWLPLRGADIRLVLEPAMLPVALMVAGVSTLIAIYSIGYMAGDRGIQRYFATLDLFVGAMLLIAVSSNLLLLFAGWELVGLCSYLLIGHWRERPAAADAALKAFVVNRVGDAAFLVGIFVILVETGTVEIASLGELSVLASALLLGGALAKSAQLPLHTWLPDAMEGPTPVSALIHAATMVTAGVVLLVRLNGPLADAVLLAAATIGAVTALGAATVALAQTDHKRVLAWSTISQVGLMFVAAGVGAVAAAVFHLLSHAFFKAALFLGAGSVLHATRDELEIGRLGGLGRRMSWTAIGFAAGALGLAAIPPAAGFFSKEAIAAATVDRPALLLAVLVVTGISSFYAARLVTLLFLTRARSDAAAGAHESPAVLLAPLLLLGAATLAFGVAVAGGVPVVVTATPERAPAWLLASSLAIAATAVLAGWLTYRDGPRAERALAVPRAGYAIDTLYARALVGPFGALAVAVDGGAERANQLAVDLVGQVLLALAALSRRLQGGYVRAYEALLLAGAVALLAYWSVR